jgi:hypothetical protein
MSTSAKPTSRFRVGDWVSFLYGPRKVRAQVIEDRGPLGVHGRRIYRVRLDLENGQSTSFEQLEDDLESADAPESTNPLLKATLGYLRQGRQFTKISPERHTAKPERKVAFHFSDNSEEVHTFQCDHATFMRWWKETSAYLHQMAEAFGSSGEMRS